MLFIEAENEQTKNIKNKHDTKVLSMDLSLQICACYTTGSSFTMTLHCNVFQAQIVIRQFHENWVEIAPIAERCQPALSHQSHGQV